MRVFLTIAACSNMEYVVHPHDNKDSGHIHVPLADTADPCTAELANRLLFCHPRVTAPAAHDSCLTLDAWLAPAPDRMATQTIMAYGGLLHFGPDIDWWITSVEYDPTFGCTLQNQYGSWYPGRDCAEPHPFICAF